MPATMERTVTVDRLLAQRADSKLQQYGWSIESAFSRLLVAIVTIPGAPENAFAVQEDVPVRRRPGGLRGKIHIAPDFDTPSDELTHDPKVQAYFER